MVKNVLLLVLAIIIFVPLKILGFIRSILYLTYYRQWDELSNYFFACAHGEDVAASSMIFRTTYKTISGVVGKKAFEEEQDGETNSYIYPFRDLIDWLFSHDPDHCYVTYLYEFEGEQKNIGG